MTPEELARQQIDAALVAAGWQVQDASHAAVKAAKGVAVRNFPLKTGHGFADYLLFVDGQAVGVIEAKKAGETLTGVEPQAEKYATGVQDYLQAPIRPLPFLFQSTGVETRFTNGLDPEPRSRTVFHFFQPATLAGWVAAEPLWFPDVPGRPRSCRPSTLRSRLSALPTVDERGLWPAQLRAVQNLERSLALDRPRALIQMATGSGKTFTAVTSSYRLIKFGGAQRVLFLVDRANLGRQALREFQQYAPPDDGRKFSAIYNVQHLTSNRIDSVSRVAITTIQRLYSMLKGDPELPDEQDEASLFLSSLGREPVPVAYNPCLPPEFFDIIFIDECHRSIYSVWRQVLEYFDAHLIGLTATPAAHTFGFFNQNLVSEYDHRQAVADGVNVDFDVYRIRTAITEQGSTVEAGPFEMVGKRDRQTRKLRWEQLDEDLSYEANELDRAVVALDQIRTIIETFRDRLPEILPGRTPGDVPKTLIYAKDDSHADDIVKMVREVFGKGNDFCVKLTYRTGTARIVTKVQNPDGTEREEITYRSNGVTAEHLLSSFRNSYYPRIACTVDLIATGTDIKPLEIVMFMRSVKSRNFFEQMKGRGVRVISDTDFQAVTATPGAKKDHFVIVDCVGVTEDDLSPTKPLERSRTISFEKLIQAVGFGATDEDMISSLAGRLARMDRQLSDEDKQGIKTLVGGKSLSEISAGLLNAIDPDAQVDEARRIERLRQDGEPSPAAVADAARTLIAEATSLFAANPALGTRLVELKKSLEQTIDTTSKDKLLVSDYSNAAREKARGLVGSFKQFIEDNREQIAALQVLYSRPYGKRLSYADAKLLADAIKAPPRCWTPDLLWQAYETLERDRVRGVGKTHIVADIVSLVRHAIGQDELLVPREDQVNERFAVWVAQQENKGRPFNHEQRAWLDAIRDQIAASLSMELEDFEYSPFAQMGGVGRAVQVFGPELETIVNELNEVLAA